MLYLALQRLDAHVENQSRIVLQRGNEKRVMNEENLGKATLTAFFESKSLNPEFFSKRKNVGGQTREMNRH
jgi:hypothetical protein